jgi:hypothetical protein
LLRPATSLTGRWKTLPLKLYCAPVVERHRIRERIRCEVGEQAAQRDNATEPRARRRCGCRRG